MNRIRWRTRGQRRRWSAPAVIRSSVLALLVLLGMASVAGAAIEDPSGAGTTPPRLGYVDGDVLFWRPGVGDWEAAQVNIPLAVGDALATRDGKLELQIGAKSFVRADDGSQLRLKSNEPDFLQLDVTAGSVAVDVRDLARGATVEVDTPNGVVGIARDGYYRVDVGNESTHVTVRRGGQAAVTPAGGSLADVATGEAVEISGTGDARLTALAAPPFDEWDRWNYDRADGFLAAPRSYAVSSDVYGTDDLERYGDWRYVGTYGRVWVPNSVPAGWAPYSYGRWIWDPLYGYSWVDYAPWGWAPYHYGRWVYNGYWAWAPGPVVGVPIYSPALVAFYGGPGFAVGIGTPFVSWVALGWGEPLWPWWGPVGFIGSPCWWGWGGPRVVNNIVINNGTVVNGHPVNINRNIHVPGAVVGVPRDQFATRNLDRVRLTQVNEKNLEPMRGALPMPARSVAPTAPGRMPPANLAAPHGGPAPANLARAGEPAAGARSFGAPAYPGGAKASAALAAVRNGGPGALSEPGQPALSKPAASTFGSIDRRGAQLPPALPAGTRSASVPRPQGQAVDSFGRRQGAFPPPVNAPGRVSNFQRIAPPSSPGAPPRRLAEVDRRGSAWSRPAVPAMQPFRAPSRETAPASAPTIGRQTFSHAPASAPSLGAARSVGHSVGMHVGGGMRGGR